MTVGVERIDGRTAVGDSSRRWQHRIVDGVVLTGTRSRGLGGGPHRSGRRRVLGQRRMDRPRAGPSAELPGGAAPRASRTAGSDRPLAHPVDRRRGTPSLLSQFPANCRRSSWKRAMRANVALNEDCIEAFDVIIANGIDAPVTDTPITAGFVPPTSRNTCYGNYASSKRPARQRMSPHCRARRYANKYPGLAGGHRRAEHQRAALRRPATIRGGFGPLGSGPWGTIHRLEIRDVSSSGSGVAMHSRPRY